MPPGPNQDGPTTAYSLIAPFVRHWLKRPPPAMPSAKPDLRANLERILKETEKQAKKAKATFDSNIKPEKTEGEDDERTAINFSWTGEGRAQGKIWHCATCDRVVVAQVDRHGERSERDSRHRVATVCDFAGSCH